MLARTTSLLVVAVWLGMVSAQALAHEGHEKAEGAAEPKGPAVSALPAPGAEEDRAAAASTAEEKARNYFTDLPLVDQNGRQVRFFSDVLKDRVVLINFMYTNCNDACPLLTKKLSDLQEMLKEQMGKQVFLVSISIDPERDTPEALRQFGERFNAGDGWIFLTGEKPNVDHVVKKLGQYTEEVESHSTAMIIGNVKTAHWKKVRPDTPPVVMAEELRALAAEA